MDIEDVNEQCCPGGTKFLRKNSHQILGPKDLNFNNLWLTRVSFSVCRLNTTCSLTTDSRVQWMISS